MSTEKLGLAAMDSWKAESKRAYWDRDVPLDAWREGVRNGHPSYLPDAVAYLPPEQFIRFYGTRSFVQDWPAMRARLPASATGKTGMLDIHWSRLAGGGWNLRPFRDFYLMPEGRRQFLTLVARMPGESIGRHADALRIKYGQAYAHAAKLSAEGKIRIAESAAGGRRLKLFPAYRVE